MRVTEVQHFISKTRMLLNQIAVGGMYYKANRENDSYIVLEQIKPNAESLLLTLAAGAFPMSVKAVERLIVLLDLYLAGARMDFGSLERGVGALTTTLEDELSTRLYLEVEPSQSDRFKKPLTDWEPMIARFPGIRHNVEECSKCFALDRYGAAAFHVLLIAEYGVIEVAKLMGVAGDKPGWGALERLRRILNRPFPDRPNWNSNTRLCWRTSSLWLLSSRIHGGTN